VRIAGLEPGFRIPDCQGLNLVFFAIAFALGLVATPYLSPQRCREYARLSAGAARSGRVVSLVLNQVGTHTELQKGTMSLTASFIARIPIRPRSFGYADLEHGLLPLIGTRISEDVDRFIQRIDSPDRRLAEAASTPSGARGTQDAQTLSLRHGPLFVGEGTCLVCASFGSTELQNADSARCCRFRNSQQKRASDLDSINAWIPKLDVAGSSPVSRSTSFQQVKRRRHFQDA
jgi:hypothetical protein